MYRLLEKRTRIRFIPMALDTGQLACYQQEPEEGFKYLDAVFDPGRRAESASGFAAWYRKPSFAAGRVARAGVRILHQEMIATALSQEGFIKRRETITARSSLPLTVLA